MMIKNWKKWMWIAVTLVGVGIILFLIALIGLKGDLSMGEYETKRYEITEGFENISISTETGDIQVAVSNDGSVWVECYEPKNLHHTATVENDTLNVGFIDERKWYEFSGFYFATPKITIYMPQGE